MTNAMTMASAVTTMQTAEKVGFIGKAKNFMHEHKMAVAVSTTAAVSVGAGVAIHATATKIKANGGCAKLKKKPTTDNQAPTEEQSA